MPWIGISPVFFVFLGDARRLQRVGEMRGKPVRNGTLEGFFQRQHRCCTGDADHDPVRGIRRAGVCPISVIRNEVDKVAALLGLPDLVFPVAGFASAIPKARVTSACACRAKSRRTAIVTMTARFPALSTITTDGGMRCMPFPRSSIVPTRIWRRGLLRLGRKTSPASRQGRRCGVPALSACTWIQLRLKGPPRPRHVACFICGPSLNEEDLIMMYSIAYPNSLSRRLMLGSMARAVCMPMLIGNAKAAGLEEIKKRGLIVATEDDFRPFEFVKDGKPTGFDNELIEDMRKAAPFEIKQEILPWTGILAGVSTGKYDVAITAVIHHQGTQAVA